MKLRVHQHLLVRQAQLGGAVPAACHFFVGCWSSWVSISAGHVLCSFPASRQEGMHILFDVKSTSHFLCHSVSEEHLFYVKVVLWLLQCFEISSSHIIVQTSLCDFLFPLPKLEDLHLTLFRSVLNIISIFVLQRPSPRRSNSPDKFKRPTPPPSPNTQSPVQPPPPPPPPPVQPPGQPTASQAANFQHSVHPSSQP